MRHIVFRLVTILILALGLAPVASAEVWTFAHFAENGAPRFSAKSFDSVLYLTNVGGVHNCKLVLLNESTPPGPVTVNGQQVCPPAAPCPVAVNGFAKVILDDKITQAAGSGWGNVLGEIRLTCAEPLARLNATLYVTNYHEDALKAAFSVDSGKILP
jgi:hypothetical protein